MEKFTTSYRHIAVDHDPFIGPVIAAAMRTTEPQREVWLASQMGDDSSCAYNESVSLRLNGSLDVQVLEQAVDHVVMRHGSLRSVFNTDGTQMVELEHVPIKIEKVDLSTLRQDFLEARLRELDKYWMRSTFDLLFGPLFRPIHIRLPNEEHILRLIAHHSICDGWSLGIIMAEISATYSALVQKQEVQLPDAIPFSTYAQATEEFQATAEFQKVRAYWKDLYSGDIPRTDLPTDRPHSMSKTYVAKRLDLPLEAPLVKSMRQLGTRSGSTLVTTLMATFELLIARKTGQHDIVIGLPAAGQSDLSMKHLVGHCVSLLPLRSQLDSANSFIEHLKERRSAILDAYDHQRFTLGNLLQELDIPREPGRVPLVSIVFNIDMGMDDGVAFHNAANERIPHQYSSDPRPFEHFELSLNCNGNGDELVMEWGFNTDLFDEQTIRSWSEELAQLIAEVCAEPETRIGKWIDQAATGTVVSPVPVEWTGLAGTIAADRTIWSMFEDMVLAHPESAAIVQGSETVTYDALRKRALRIAGTLTQKGVHRGDVVAMLLTPGPDLMAVMLAICRCGAAYLPIDPHYPEERISLTLQDAQPILVITQAVHQERITSGSSILVIDAKAAIGAAPVHESALPALPDCNDAAYVIYTSGSTGKPKGVVVPHRGIVRLVDARSFIPFSHELTWMHHLSIGFDASMLSVWGALLNGGCLAIPSDPKPSLNDLADTMLLHKVNCISTASGLFDLLVEERMDALKGLRHLITGGDVISLRHARRVLEEVGPGVLVNAYGPTENSVVSTAFILRSELSLERPLPIGKPFLNSTTHVLNERMEPVGIGERGELYTGGPGTALGYLNRPEITAERFVPDPFSSEPGALLYRTGDMVRWLPDGDIEFFGRQDDQVKVRGFRIELGEIDAALNDMPGITQKTVIAVAHSQGEKELLAYVVPADKSALEPSAALKLATAVREHLARKLPEHMVPASVITMESLPLNNSGKVDKAKLPKPIRSRSSTGQHTPPVTMTEQALATIWSGLLGVSNIGVHDNFFELGGHSLIGLQMFAQVEARFGRRLQLKTLFQAPTIAQLADVIGTDKEEHHWKNMVAVQPKGSRIPFFCVNGDEANLLMPPHLGADQPFYGFAHQGEDGGPIAHTTVEAIAASLVAEMRTVRPRGPYLLSGYSFGGVVAFEMAQQLMAAGEDVPVLALLDSYDPQEYRTVMKQEEKLHEPLKKYVLSKLIDLLLSQGRTLPHRLRHWHIMRTYDRAIASYHAAPYRGDLTLFRSKESAGPFDMGWKKIVEGELDVVVLEGDHYDMMKDSHIARVAAHLAGLFAKRTRATARQVS